MHKTAYALVRICLGINILMHGLVRLVRMSAFEATLQAQFSHTFLPVFSVHLAGWLIMLGETTVGTLVVLGLALRPALIAGLLEMLLLQFGVTLIGNWSVAGIQLIYVVIYGVLLAMVEHDAFGLDAWLLGRREASRVH